NILVQHDGGELDFKLIDTARTRVFTKGLPRSKRLADLTRATHKLNAAGREVLLQHYFNTHGKPLAASVRLRFAVYDYKAHLKRRLRQSQIYRAMRS
ncbi:hypothetical protein RZS08_45180, partial [Arthrospira platensis SPKY1]|nr:hypothetical protein [Arthrospira platensis SPKY1]